MKVFVVSLVMLILAGCGFYYWTSQKKPTSTRSMVITRIGILKKTAIKDVDFTHMIVSNTQSWGVASYSVKLDEYIGKNVKVKGQNSGTTLYIDSIQVFP